MFSPFAFLGSPIMMLSQIPFSTSVAMYRKKILNVFVQIIVLANCYVYLWTEFLYLAAANTIVLNGQFVRKVSSIKDR